MPGRAGRIAQRFRSDRATAGRRPRRPDAAVRISRLAARRADFGGQPVGEGLPALRRLLLALPGSAASAVRASISRSPRTSMYGTFCSWAAPDLVLHPVRRVVDLDAQAARRAGRAASSRGRLEVAIGDRDDDRLDRGEPERERARRSARRGCR